MECPKCKVKTIKHGNNRKGEQRYYCRLCSLSFQKNFTYQSYTVADAQLILLTKEGCGIRSTGRILGFHPNTVLRRILKIARNIQRLYHILKGKSYQVDELFTYVKHKDKRICIAYSFEAKTKHVLNFVVGRRNKTNLRKVTSTLIFV